MEHFPSIETRDLEGRRYVLPDDLPEGRRLIVVAFQQWQQILVEGWKAEAGDLQTAHPDLTVWEVPSLSKGYTLARPYIDGGMRAGIPDIFVRQHTLTAYTDLRVLTRELGVTTRETVWVYLLDRAGRITWSESGQVDVAKAAALAAALEADAA
jgi:hypothetical protein